MDDELESPKKSRFVTWPKKIAASALIWGVLWLILEILLRFLGYGDFIIYKSDGELLWVPRSNQMGKTVVGRRPITINDQGLRYRVDLTLKNPNEHRIVAFGDSVTMGWGLDDDSHYSAVLEKRLTESYPEGRFRVVSAGVNAYPTVLCVRRFIKMLERGDQIDTAILAYSFNNGYERLAGLDEDGRRRFMRKVQLKSVLRRSAIYNLVIEDWLRNAVYYRVRGRLMAGSWETDQKHGGDDLDVYIANLERMRTESEKHGVRLIFLLLPSKGQQAELSEFQKAFSEFAQNHGVPLVNIIERFELLNHGSLFMDHTHPSSQGHALIAESLFPIAAELPEQP